MRLQLTTAAALIERGLAVFPLPAGSKAAEPGWHRTVTTKPAALEAWPADANIGVACRRSRIVAVDLDCKQGVNGHDTWRAVCAGAHRPMPRTFTVATPNGGWHLYFRTAVGHMIPSTIGRWPGIDVRAPGTRIGGYLAGPGSTVGGRRYEIALDVPILPLPHWLLVRLAAAP